MARGSGNVEQLGEGRWRDGVTVTGGAGLGPGYSIPVEIPIGLG